MSGGKITAKIRLTACRVPGKITVAVASFYCGPEKLFYTVSKNNTDLMTYIKGF